MKRLLFFLLSATVAFSQTNVQKGAGNVISNGPVTFGAGSPLTLSGVLTANPAPGSIFNFGNVTVSNLTTTGGFSATQANQWRNRLNSAPVNIMVDMDWGQDADDIGSLAVLHRLADLGEVNIVAMANSYTQLAGSAAIVAVNSFYGRPNIPVGQGSGGVTGDDNYLTATKIFPNRQQTTTPPTAVSVYRKALASMPDASVVFYVEGPMTNLNALYNSAADSISPLTGSALMAQKLSKLVILGGIYPGGGSEYDFISDPTATQVINQLTSAITVVFQGFECGTNVQTNSNQPVYSIIKAGYTALFANFPPGNTTTRSSWGALGVIYCVRGLSFSSDTYFTLSSVGVNSVDGSGINTWTPGGTKGQKYLIQALGNSAFATVVQTLQDTLPLENYTPPVLLASAPGFYSPLTLNPPTSSQVNFFNSATLKGIVGIDDGSSIVAGATAGWLSSRSELGIYSWSGVAGSGSLLKFKVDTTTSGGTTISAPTTGDNLILDTTSTGKVRIGKATEIFPATSSQVNFYNTTTLRGILGMDDGSSIISGATAGWMSARSELGIYGWAGVVGGGSLLKFKVDTTTSGGTTLSAPNGSDNLTLDTAAGVVRSGKSFNVVPATLSQVNFYNGATYRGSFGIDDGNSIITGGGAGNMAFRAGTGIYAYAGIPGDGPVVRFKVDTTTSGGTTLSNPTTSAILNLATGSGGSVQIQGVTIDPLGASSGDVLKFDGSKFVPGTTSGAGTVTSAGIIGQNGIGTSGSPITGAGNVTLSLGAITPISISTSTATLGVTGAGNTTITGFGNVSGNFTVGGNATITGTIAASNFSGSSSGTNTGDQTSVTGNAGTATALQTGRTFALTGDVTGTSGSFNGTANASTATTLATVNSTTGSYGSATKASTITVNGKGLVTVSGEVTVTPAVGSITGLGTGVAAALVVANNSAGGYSPIDGTATLTNKRVTARITTITSSATPTVNTDACDCVTITALAAAITSMTSSLSGTPVNFDQLEYRIKDDGTARAITWGSSFVAGSVALPTTTVLSKILRVWFEWDSVQSKWVCISSASDL